MLDEIEDANDMRMIERRESTRFSHEPRSDSRVPAKRTRKLLDRNIPTELLMASVKNNPPEPTSDLTLNLVAGERLPH